MSDHEYTLQRICILENALRDVMSLLIESFPHTRNAVNCVGRIWDAELDNLDKSK